ncbi:RNA exonuclease 3 [Podila epigama]|nr:RNA exonuclease 3 [Podila epigama]
MFTSSGLFKSLPCPFLPTCTREAYCIFSHSISPTPEAPPATATSQPATTSTTSKRKLGPANKDSPEAPPTKQSRHGVQEKSLEKPSVTPIAAMEMAKQRRQTYDTIASPPTSSSLSGSKRAGLGAGAGVGSSSAQAVLLARPQVSKASSASAATKTTLSTTGASGPPVLKIDLRAHSKPQFRQAVATQYYKEFLRIYTPLGDLGSRLATAHAVEQEKDVHGKTNAGTYRNQASNILLRLKKRPVAVSEDDVGIDGVWTDPKAKNSETDVWKNAASFVPPATMLEKYGYPIEIPSGPFTPLDPVQTCDRCHKQFEVRDTLSEEDKLACKYHDRRISRKLINGERIKIHACCDGIQGSEGCREGPHVFKEDNFLHLHSRIPFVKAAVKEASDKKKHRIVAMDCEMCYTSGGFELIRISAIDKDGKVILDELVRPKHEIWDLNSRFSGITSIDNAKYDLEQARGLFLDLIDEETIIIGQSLENDFKVLRLVHNQVIDTAMLYPHPLQAQRNVRYSLQVLAREHLKINIQDSEHGHDSFEDAKTCLDLVRLKITKDSANKAS